MDKVVSLAEFTSVRRPGKANPPSVHPMLIPAQGMPPDHGLRMDDVRDRNYASLPDGIHAILRVTEILDAEFGADASWQGLTLRLLREIHHRFLGYGDENSLAAVCRDIEAYAAAGVHDGNALAIGAVVTLLRLLERSPQVRANTLGTANATNATNATGAMQ